MNLGPKPRPDGIDRKQGKRPSGNGFEFIFGLGAMLDPADESFTTVVKSNDWKNTANHAICQRLQSSDPVIGLRNQWEQ